MPGVYFSDVDNMGPGWVWGLRLGLLLECWRQFLGDTVWGGWTFSRKVAPPPVLANVDSLIPLAFHSFN